MHDRIQPHSTVVVIGAGASGIAASEKLLATGFKVVLVEARDRMRISYVLCFDPNDALHQGSLTYSLTSP